MEVRERAAPGKQRREPSREPSKGGYFHRHIAAEISALARYYDRVVQWEPHASDTGALLDAIECEHKEVARGRLPEGLRDERDSRTAVLLNATFNYHLDIQELLSALEPQLAPTSRVVAVCYNPYLSWLYRLAHRLGLREAELPDTFLTRSALANLVKLSGYEVVRERFTGYVPFRWLGLGTLVDRVLSLLPGLRLLGVALVVILRPVRERPERPSLSVVIPARNERGNIEAALRRMPDFGGADLEVLFVEGHSTDGTWEEIERVVEEWKPRIRCRAYRQTGVGKADAVRLGFTHSQGELLTILDADLTMPPEQLSRYYEAYCRGLGDFVNGSRLVYPMEGEAMRFLNQLGNVFFAKALSAVLGARISDALCGTKLVARHDYRRFMRWRDDFGDFDPFGDFELLFPAAILALGIIDVPVRYRARTYGATNIHRFRHGWMLLKMTVLGFLRVKPGRA